MAEKMPIGKLLDMVSWTEVEPIPEHQSYIDESKIPYATHRGILRISEVELTCYQLSDGRRIFDADEVYALFSALIEEF